VDARPYRRTVSLSPALRCACSFKLLVVTNSDATAVLSPGCCRLGWRRSRP